MQQLVVLCFIGFVAQLVDGSLGMAYGVTSTSLLLFVGASPIIASSVVHLAEVGTTLVSGLSHWRFGNVDWRVVKSVSLPGAIGAFFGATLLSRVSTEAAGPLIASLLLILGAFILFRAAQSEDPRPSRQPLHRHFLVPLGLFAGFIDATGGGGWGPLGTPALLASGRLAANKVIGSVDTSEFFVSVAASLGGLFRTPAVPRPVGGAPPTQATASTQS